MHPPLKQHLENLFPSVCGNKWNKYSHCVHEDSFINENQALCSAKALYLHNRVLLLNK